jgi:LacI family transcriptional regulator
MASVREIAQLAGVSVSTVSLVLNDKPGVSDEMRRTVLDALKQLEAKELNVPSPGKEARRSSESRLLSIVVLHPPILRSSYVFSEVLQGIQAAAEIHRVQLRLIANDEAASPQHVSQLYFSDPALRPDGVIVFGAKQHEPLIDEARRLEIPCVVLGRDASKYKVSGVGRDEEHYAYEATRYLLELGHRVIAFAGGQETYDYVPNRISGYRRALSQAGIEAQPSWVQLGSGAYAIQALLKQASNLTAVLFVNDSYAAEGLPVLQNAGWRIPNDISVISFDDTNIAHDFVPSLTSVAYRRYEEGQWAVKLLIDQIHFPFIESTHTFFKAQLMIRESCAPPRA